MKILKIRTKGIAATLLGTTSVGALALIVTTSMLLAADEYNTTNGLTLNGYGLGFHGIDTVSMIENREMVTGTAQFAIVHDGVEYYFASQASMNTFSTDPDAYLPQFGGFCALGVALKKKLDGDPRYADIRDGKLYVFVNDDIYQKYLEDPEGTIANAEAAWPGIRDVAVQDL